MTDILQRRCSCCGRILPATTEYFVVLKNKAKNWEGLSAECRECRYARYRQWYGEGENRKGVIARAIESTRKLRATPEGKEKDRRWSRESARRRFVDKETRAQVTARDRAWRHANPERVKKFKHQHPAYKRMQTMKRHAAELQATPPWLTAEDKRKIETIYAIADYLTRKTGIPHDVDHYYPLRNLVCCGLHVPWNMRVIPADRNQSKGNRLPV